MTSDPNDQVNDEDPDSQEGADSLRDLLRRTKDLPPPPPKKDLLRGVQKKLRRRSGGKFYADGWSTRDENPRSTYLVTASVMLVVLVLVYFALAPGGFVRLP